VDYLCSNGRQLARLGTGNVSVQRLLPGERWVGYLAVLSEAAKGIAPFTGSLFLSDESAWELIALIAVMGRLGWRQEGYHLTLFGGFVVHDPKAALLVFLIGGISLQFFEIALPDAMEF
jgi:hypothetical protein